MSQALPWDLAPRIAARLLFLRRSQWWSPERVGRYADARLRDLVRHAGRHVPYYRALFRDIGLDPETFRGRADLPRIPPLDKQTLRARYPEFLSDTADVRRMTCITTSGSTGSPTEIRLDRASRVHDAAATLRTYGWAGYTPFLTRGFWSRAVRQPEPLAWRMAGRVLLHDPRILDADFIPRLWREINRLRPAVFNGYPYTLVLLAEMARDAGLDYHRPRAIICVGETLAPALRRRLEELYGTPRIFSHYSLTENVALIADCPRRNLHVMDDFAFHEFVDASGAPVAEGRCEILGTAYFSHGMPFIRYRTGDFAEVRSAAWRCPCGRPQRGVAAIEGRREDSLRTPDGRRVAGIRTMLQLGHGIAACQIVQDRLDHIYLNLIPGPGFSAASQAALERDLRQRLGPRVAIEFRIGAPLEHRPGDSGKIPFTLTRIAPSLYDADADLPEP